MNLASLVLFGLINGAMVLNHLLKKNRIFEFPFWAGIIALGWFMPMAIGGCANASQFPEYAYSNGMFFASLCTGGLWISYHLALKKEPVIASWLYVSFDGHRLYVAAIIFTLFGFFFEWKLSNLPSELLAMTQWSGITVRYYFLASVFKFGFLVLWLMYLRQPKIFVPKILAFLVPGLLLLLKGAVLGGSRAVMMDLVSYIFVSLWFVRRFTLPRWMLIYGLVGGVVLINGIGVYRSIMKNKDLSVSERLSEAIHADYTQETESVIEESGEEFKNYIFYRRIYEEEDSYDFGARHWNLLIFNYVPAQIVGRKFKQSLMLPLMNPDVSALKKYGHKFARGTTSTGYLDAFGSFGWLGFIKFCLIGSILGTLYRYAMHGSFLGQLLYVYLLTKGMHAVSHGTHDVLVRAWVYFFLLGYPLLKWAEQPAEDRV